MIIAELELKLEKSDDKSECLEKELANALETNNESKKGTEKVINEKKNLKTRIECLEHQSKEDKDTIVMLENCVSNKVSENSKLKEELDHLTKSQYHCIFCDCKSETDDNLKNHVRNLHDEK